MKVSQYSFFIHFSNILDEEELDNDWLNANISSFGEAINHFSPYSGIYTG